MELWFSELLPYVCEYISTARLKYVRKAQEAVVMNGQGQPAPVVPGP